MTLHETKDADGDAWLESVTADDSLYPSDLIVATTIADYRCSLNKTYAAFNETEVGRDARIVTSAVKDILDRLERHGHIRKLHYGDNRRPTYALVIRPKSLRELASKPTRPAA